MVGVVTGNSELKLEGELVEDPGVVPVEAGADVGSVPVDFEPGGVMLADVEAEAGVLLPDVPLRLGIGRE
jgi:hypothetical protein